MHLSLLFVLMHIYSNTNVDPAVKTSVKDGRKIHFYHAMIVWDFNFHLQKSTYNASFKANPERNRIRNEKIFLVESATSYTRYL